MVLRAATRQQDALSAGDGGGQIPSCRTGQEVESQQQGRFGLVVPASGFGALPATSLVSISLKLRRHACHSRPIPFPSHPIPVANQLDVPTAETDITIPKYR